MTEISKQEMEAVASQAAEKAVTDILEKLGIDADNFRESQADFAHLRKQRKAFEQVTTVTTKVVLTTVIGGFFAAVLMGIKEFLNK